MDSYSICKPPRRFPFTPPTPPPSPLHIAPVAQAMKHILEEIKVKQTHMEHRMRVSSKDGAHWLQHSLNNNRKIFETSMLHKEVEFKAAMKHLKTFLESEQNTHRTIIYIGFAMQYLTFTTIYYQKLL